MSKESRHTHTPSLGPALHTYFSIYSLFFVNFVIYLMVGS